MPRKTPLQYEEVEGVFYVTSARGKQADWLRNLAACPEVQVQVGGRHFSTVAILITDPCQAADFIELRMRKHPQFMGMMLRLEGLPARPTRADLEEFAKRLAVVKLDPDNSLRA
jgi:deazaflavin-dependent oxidoreductase (nitroreductase family)